MGKFCTVNESSTQKGEVQTRIEWKSSKVWGRSACLLDFELFEGKVCAWEVSKAIYSVFFSL